MQWACFPATNFHLFNLLTLFFSASSSSTTVARMEESGEGQICLSDASDAWSLHEGNNTSDDYSFEESDGHPAISFSVANSHGQASRKPIDDPVGAKIAYMASALRVPLRQLPKILQSTMNEKVL